MLWRVRPRTAQRDGCRGAGAIVGEVDTAGGTAGVGGREGYRERGGLVGAEGQGKRQAADAEAWPAGASRGDRDAGRACIAEGDSLRTALLYHHIAKGDAARAGCQLTTGDSGAGQRHALGAAAGIVGDGEGAAAGTQRGRGKGDGEGAAGIGDQGGGASIALGKVAADAGGADAQAGGAAVGQGDGLRRTGAA